MTSTRRSRGSGSQGGFALVLAAAVFIVSLFLWTEARADTPAPPEAGLVRLSEMNESALLIRTVDAGLYIPAPLVATDIALDIAR